MSVSKEQFDAAIDELFPIQVGEVLVSSETNTEVRVIEKTSSNVNEKTIEGFTVVEVLSGKTFFAPKNTLKTKSELNSEEE